MDSPNPYKLVEPICPECGEGCVSAEADCQPIWSVIGVSAANGTSMEFDDTDVSFTLECDDCGHRGEPSAFAGIANHELIEKLAEEASELIEKLEWVGMTQTEARTVEPTAPRLAEAIRAANRAICEAQRQLEEVVELAEEACGD